METTPTQQEEQKANTPASSPQRISIKQELILDYRILKKLVLGFLLLLSICSITYSYVILISHVIFSHVIFMPYVDFMMNLFFPFALAFLLLIFWKQIRRNNIWGIIGLVLVLNPLLVFLVEITTSSGANVLDHVFLSLCSSSPLGLLISFIGVFKTPRKWAIVGLVIGLIELILLIGIFMLWLAEKYS